ncbi:MAG TPA: sigma-54 dependent transcriptional regulator [Gammaproteobacteria bacterium]|nr:sigma-54 dependent transcriptional regulator [Gammaproteobacteria bacterium]
MGAATTVLVIDADRERRQALKTIIEFVDYVPLITADCEHWQDDLPPPAHFHVVLLGQCRSEQALMQVFYAVREWAPALPILLLADANKTYTNPDLNAGILGKINPPLRYAQFNYVLHQAQIYHDSRQPTAAKRPLEMFRSLVGNSRAIKQVRHMIDQVADSDANVLILGESGTGKEVVARNLHYHSSRRDKNFVPVNCGAIPSELLESELFGHEKGAFTGAISARQGRFELAEGGTLFLDEIGDMSLPMQVKLLRVLQERTFERVGSNKSISADVRIIAATHLNLEKAINNGKFREDLFYRLNVFPIDMPPLRSRVEDIPLLVNELILRIEHEKRGSVRITPTAVLSLCQYPWLGNVRELANLIERLAILYPYGVVDLADLPEKFRMQTTTLAKQGDAPEALAAPLPEIAAPSRLPRSGLDLKEHIKNLEITLIQQALDEAGGVVARAATRLKMRRTTLVEKLRKYGLQRADETTVI